MTHYEHSLYPDTNLDMPGSIAPLVNSSHSDEVVMDCLNMLAASVDLDTATDSFLETLGCFYSASAAYVFEASPDDACFVEKFVWRDPDRHFPASTHETISAESIQTWINLFESDGTLCLSSDNCDLTPVTLFHPDSAHSFMAAPLYINAKLSGFVCVVDPATYFGEVKVLLAVASLTVVELHKLRLTEQLKYLHHKDPLTDAYNRFSYVDSLVKNYQYPPTSMGVITASVNDLRSVNSVLGDKFGDAIVQRTAEIMRETLCTDIYRIGGDEFLSMHPNISYEDFQALFNTVQQAFLAESGCNVAVGAAWDNSPIDMKTLVIEADKQLLGNKTSLRNK